MIRIAHLSKTYGAQTLFSDANLIIGEKEKIGLIGRNGSGKSTFLKILLDQESYDEGIIEVPKRVTVRSLEQRLQFSESTILAQVCTGLPADAAEEDWKAKSVLMGLGFTTDDFNRSPAEFSSGMQVRIRLAEVLVSESQLLLLDEPTNYLDILSLRWLERFLQQWKGAFILVTHDQSFMERVVTHVVGIHRGKMRKMTGDPQKLLAQIEKEEEIHETTRVNMEKKQAKTKEFISKFRAGARSAGLVQSRIKSLEKQEIKEKLEKLSNIVFHFQPLEFKGGTLMEATNIDFSYEPDTSLISKFSLRVQPKERIAIIGRNGKGKSTLLKVLTQELSHQSGKIKQHANLQIGYFAAGNADSLNPQHTILSELMMLPNVSEQQVRAICGALLFSGTAMKKHIEYLSGGEKIRVCFAKVLLSPAHLLVLDEPTNHLDMESCQALTRALQDFAGTVLLVTHDEKLLASLATRLVVFDRSETTVYDKTYEEFLEQDGWSDEEGDGISFKKHKTDSNNSRQYLAGKQQQKSLRQLQTKQKNLTKELELLEAQQVENATLLQLAYAESNRDQMEMLGRTAKRLAEEISDGYEELGRLIESEKS